MKRLLCLLLFLPCLACAQERGLALGKSQLGGVFLTNGLLSLCLECAEAPRNASLKQDDPRGYTPRPGYDDDALLAPQPLTLQVRLAF